ncbi:hypothetical protein [Helicobacter sp. 23-1045]
MEKVKVLDRKSLSYLSKAKKAFLAKDYALSLRLYNDLTLADDENKEAKIGVLLSDIAVENEEQAQKLFEYYQILKLQKIAHAEDNILNIISLLDRNTNHFAELVNDFENAKINDIDGILYSDFKKLVRGSNFKKIFEYAMFSTKIIFTNKGDFVEFLDLLVENDFGDVAMQYIETLDSANFYDKKIQDILKKALENAESSADSAKNAESTAESTKKSTKFAESTKKSAKIAESTKGKK